MAYATVVAKPPYPPPSSHCRNTSSPSASSFHAFSTLPSSLSPSPFGSRYPSSSATVSPRPSSAPASVLGYTSTIRTISPQIANFRPSSRDIVKAIAPHVLDERRTRRRSSPSRFGHPSRSRKAYHYSHPHRDQPFSQHSQPYPSYWTESGLAYHSGGKKKLNPSPLRVAAVIRWDDNGSIYLQQSSSDSQISITIDKQSEGTKRPCTSPAPRQPTVQMQSPSPLDSPKLLPISDPSHTRDSSGSSAYSSESSATTNSSGSTSSGGESCAGNDALPRKRIRGFRLEYPRLLKSIAIKLKPLIKSRFVRSQ